MTWDEYRDNFDGVPVFFIKKLAKAFGCVVQIHKFAKADAPGCFHSHPAWAIRIILWGGYVEETGGGRWRTWFPGRIGIVSPDYEHRIGGLRNGKSSWSLWLRGPKIASINVRGCDTPPAPQTKTVGGSTLPPTAFGDVRSAHVPPNSDVIGEKAPGFTPSFSGVPPQTHVAALPQDVVNLVIAAREFWDANNDPSDESKALDKALEPFSSKVQYADEPDGDEDACVMCGEHLEDGDQVYWSANDDGHMHAECATSYVDDDGKETDVPPKPMVFRSSTAPQTSLAGDNLLDHVGFIFWDGDDPKGYDDAFFVWGKEDPAHEPGSRGDHQGHMWVSFPVFRKAPPPEPNVAPSDDLRKRVMRAIFDPGATEGFKGERDLTTWQTDAVMRAIATTEGSDRG